ncbi:MAG: phosphatidate cytidylyltransferase [Endomicrobia bacterium]|nr:phosphatidate cytidylyltransferase [Endomicrobiia bacterium]
MLLPRILVGVFGIPIAIISIYYGNFLFLLFLLIILIYILKEFVYMVNKVGYEISGFIAFLVGIVMFFSIILEHIQFSKLSIYFTSTNITLILLFISLLEIIRQKPLGAVGRISVSFLFPFFFAWCLSHLYLIRDIKNYGMKLTYILFFTIWIADNSSYFFGSIFGKKKLASVVSPKKTIVGFVSSIIFGILGFLFFCRIFQMDMVISFKELMLVAIIITPLITISDLTESLIKRDCGFKDSDDLLFGHGGMMDRFDSFLFTSPIFYYLILFFLKSK